MSKILAAKKIIISLFLVLGFISAFLLGDLRFSFDFNQFFPQGDEDIIFYTDFMKVFGADDSFLLIAVKNENTIFEKQFLTDFHQFSLQSKNLPNIKESKSLTTLFYPVKNSFGYSRLPIIHWNDSSKYEKDWKKLKQDGIFLNSLIDKDATSLVVALETKDELNYEQSLELIDEVQRLLNDNNLEEYHLLGRSSFGLQTICHCFNIPFFNCHGPSFILWLAIPTGKGTQCNGRLLSSFDANRRDL